MTSLGFIHLITSQIQKNIRRIIRRIRSKQETSNLCKSENFPSKRDGRIDQSRYDRTIKSFQNSCTLFSPMRLSKNIINSFSTYCEVVHFSPCEQKLEFLIKGLEFSEEPSKCHPTSVARRGFFFELPPADYALITNY